MGTVIRPELSKKNRNWIEKHRYYELKHFCMQYNIWKQTYVSLGGLASKPEDTEMLRNKYSMSNPTERIGIDRANLSEKMKMIEDAAEETDKDLAKYIVLAVTKGLSYNTLRTVYEIPCCKDVYYEAYRRFFWILSKIRN